jgi:hypothetical protein
MPGQTAASPICQGSTSMAIIRRRKRTEQQFQAVKALIVSAKYPHEVHAARHFAHPNAARVWKGRC